MLVSQEKFKIMVCNIIATFCKVLVCFPLLIPLSSNHLSLSITTYNSVIWVQQRTFFLSKVLGLVWLVGTVSADLPVVPRDALVEVNKVSYDEAMNFAFGDSWLDRDDDDDNSTIHLDPPDDEIDPHNDEDRIIGGTEASTCEYPFAVVLNSGR